MLQGINTVVPKGSSSIAPRARGPSRRGRLKQPARHMRVDTLLSVASLLQPLTLPLHGRTAVMLASSEFSRPFSVDRKQKFQKAELIASPEECAELCKRFDLEGLDSLVAEVKISRVKMGEDTLRVRASGSLTGLGVSRKNFGGEPVTLNVQAVEFEAYYATESEDDTGGELDLSNDEAFDEPIIDGEINLVRPTPPTHHPPARPPDPTPPRPASVRLSESQRASAHPHLGRGSWWRSSSTCTSPSSRCRRRASGPTLTAYRAPCSTTASRTSPTAPPTVEARSGSGWGFDLLL
jgi:hypothetical protein